MNDHEKTTYLANLKKASLSKEAKLRMREELASFADFHSVRIPQRSRSITTMQSNSVFVLFTNFSRTRIMKATLALALIVGLGGGTSFAAQQSVPGDALYPVKVHVNENVRTAFAFDANAQAKVQAALLEERLEEANTLASRGDFEGETEARVQANIAAQVDKAIEASERADAEVSTEVRLAISTALRSFGTRLAVAPVGFESQGGAAMRTESMMMAKGDTRMGMGGDSMNVSAFGTSELAADISVDSIIAQAQARLKALQSTIAGAVALGVQVKADFEAQLQKAGEHITTAQAHMKAGAEVQAEASAQQAHEIMGEVESALSLMGEVKIDMNTGHIIGIDLSGNTSSGAGVSGSGSASVETDSAVEVDPMPAVLPPLGI